MQDYTKIIIFVPIILTIITTIISIYNIIKTIKQHKKFIKQLNVGDKCLVIVNYNGFNSKEKCEIIEINKKEKWAIVKCNMKEKWFNPFIINKKEKILIKVNTNLIKQKSK
jgi:hypothetical protein